jgi:diguanylate cyclase (GGDEF)-like protein/PAS domain S-box-containing protein
MTKPTDQGSAIYPASPLRLFAILLGLIFLIETGVMLFLHTFVDTSHSFITETVLDASLLATGIAPLLWYFVVRPLRHALSGEAARARAIMDTAVEGIITTDATGEIQSFNRAAEGILGYRAEEAIGQSFQQLLFNDNSSLAGPPRLTRSSDMQVRHKDGRMVPVEITVSEFLVEGKRNFAAIVRDVAERTKAQEALRDSEERYRQLFNASNDAMLLHGMDAQGNPGHFLDVNDIACQRLGYGREELLRMTPLDIDAPEQHHLLPETIEQLFRDKRAVFERIHVAKDGQRIPVEISTHLFELMGLPLALSIARDITERKQAEIALEESERNAKALLNATTESIVLIDILGKVIAANNTAAARFKLLPEQFVGRNVYTMMSPELARLRQERNRRVIEEKQPLVAEDERDGMRFESSTYPILDGQGKVARLAIYAVDISEKHLALNIETLFREINQQTLSGSPVKNVLSFVCAEVARLFDATFVWLARKEEDGSVSLLAKGGTADSYQEKLQQIGVRWDNTPQGSGPIGSAIRSGQPQVFTKEDPRFALWFEAASVFGFQSFISIPMVIRGSIYGAFSLYSNHPHAFDAPALVEKLSAIASRVGVVLEAAMDQEKVRMLVAALESASNAIFITNSSGNIEWANHAFSQLSGYSLASVQGQNARILSSGHHDKEYYKTLWDTITQGNAWVSESVDRHRDGHLYTVQQTITPVYNEAGEITHFIAVHEDITEKKKAQERIRHLAQYDTLTSLPNRALFFEQLVQHHALAKRSQRTLALLFIDLDGFKKVNDMHGHHIGDLLLKGVAKRLKSSIRDSDIPARLGGDEFTIILPDIESETNAAAVAKKIISSLGRPFHLEGHEVKIGASIGIAMYTSGTTDPEALIKLADGAMYEAKRGGKNCCQMASPVE